MCVFKYYITPSNFVLASANQKQKNYTLIISPVLVKILKNTMDFSGKYSEFDIEIKKYMKSCHLNN